MILRSFLQTTYSLPRRTITRLIDEGKIFLNTQVVQSYQSQINAGDHLSIPSLKIQITFQEKQIEKSDSPELILFHKPAGYICSKSDPHNPTFYELLPPELKKYYYIGRLDKESRGLVLLTKNPKLVHEFEHPSKHITKEYEIQLNKSFDRKLEAKILAGIKDQGELLRTLKIYPISSNQL